MTEPHPDAHPFAERHWRFLLSAIVLLAAALRAYGLGQFSIWYDESTSIFALQYVDWDLRFLKAEETRLIPLNTLFLFFWYAIVEALPGVEMGSRTSDFLLHMLPGGFSLLTVPLLFAFTRRVTGSAAAGLVAAFLGAISPFQMYYASELGPHSLYAILVLLAMYSNYRALEENKLRFWIASVAFEALSFYAYYFSVFYLASVNLFVLLNFRAYRGVFRRWIVCQIVAGLLVLPAIILAAFVFQMHTAAAAHWFPYPTLKTLLLTFKDWFAGYSPRPAVYWPLFALGMGAFALGALALRNRPRNLGFLVFAAFLPLVMQIVFWNTQTFAFYTMRIQLAYSLPAFALAGAGLAAAPFARARLALVALIAAFTAPALVDHYAQHIHPVFEHRMGARYKVDNRGAADFVREHWREGDVVAHASTVTLGPFLYHYLDAPQVFASLGPEEWEAHLLTYPDEKVWESIGFLPERLDDFVRDAPRAWLVSAAWEPLVLYPHGILLRDWLDANGVRLRERHAGEVDVYLFDLSRPAPANRVADLGWYTQTQPASDNRVADLELFPEARDPGALDVWIERVSADGIAFVHLRNRSTNRRTVSFTTGVAPDIFSSLAFSREPDSDVWRPILGTETRVANWARVSTDATGGTLTKEVGPNSAPRDLYIEIAGEPGDVARPDLEIALQQGDRETTLNLIRGADLPIDDQWRWTNVARIPPMIESASLIVRAKLPDGVESARIQLGTVAIIDAADTPWQPIADEVVTLEPLQEITVEMSLPTPPGDAGATAWMEFYDAPHRVHRALSWRVEASQ